MPLIVYMIPVWHTVTTLKSPDCHEGEHLSSVVLGQLESVRVSKESYLI